jgi:hypothetical protein
VRILETERDGPPDAPSTPRDEHNSAGEHFSSIAVASSGFAATVGKAAVAAGMVTMGTKRPLGSAKAAALPTAGAGPELATAPMEGSTRWSTNVWV